MLISVPPKDPSTHPNVINGLVEVAVSAFDFETVILFCKISEFLVKSVYNREAQPLYQHHLWHLSKSVSIPRDLTGSDKLAFLWLKDWRLSPENYGLSITGNCGAKGCMCSVYD